MDTTSYWVKSSETQRQRYPSVNRDVGVDVVVVGGGLTGITTAYLLKQSGVRVALLERRRLTDGDTSRTTAHLTYVTDLRLHDAVKKFGKDGAHAFWDAGAAAINQIDQIVRTQRIACEFRRVAGYLHVPVLGSARGKGEEGLQKDAALAQEFGFNATFIPKVPLMERSGVRFENQAKFHPLRYLDALAKTIPGEGSFIFEESSVSEFQDQPLAVMVGAHKISAQYAVIATHTPLLGNASTVGGALFQSKLALYTSYVLGALVPNGTLSEALYWDITNPYYYARVDRHSEGEYLIFGGRDAKSGQEKDALKIFALLEEDLKRLLPNAQVKEHWLGQVVETNDGLPFIGEAVDNQFIATGFCGNGFTLGTIAALMARDHYLGKRNPWIDLFEPSRKKLLAGAWRYLSENIDYPYYLVRDHISKEKSDSLKDIQRGDGKLIEIDGKKIAAARDEEGHLHLLNPTCTHLQCTVKWNNADKTWDCPCHGSRFSMSGEVIGGPAEDPLAPAEIRNPAEKDPRANESGMHPIHS